MIVEELSRERELELLTRALNNDEFLGNGSSRAVYSLGDGYCVKVAIEVAGIKQSKREVALYQDHIKEFGVDNTRLAHIVAYGKYCLVMEEVIAMEAGDLEDVYSEYNDFTIWQRISSDKDLPERFGDFLDDDDKFTKSQAEELCLVKDFLDELVGCSTDNFQLGYNTETRLVAYDYGYTTDDSLQYIGTRTHGLICDEGEFVIIEIAISNLSDEIETEESDCFD